MAKLAGKPAAEKVMDVNLIKATLVPLSEIYESPEHMKMHRAILRKYDDVMWSFGWNEVRQEPITAPFTPASGRWQQERNKRYMYKLLEGSHKNTLVAKGIGTFDDKSEERDNQSPFPIQVSRWFLKPHFSVSYGLTSSYAKQAFNSAIAYKAACEKYGAEANVLEPIALLNVEEMPVEVAKGHLAMLPVEKCFMWQLAGVSRVDRLAYSKTLLDLGFGRKEIQGFFDRIKKVNERVGNEFLENIRKEIGISKEELLREAKSRGVSPMEIVLSKWKPVVEIYVAEAANLRVGAASQAEILEAIGIGRGGRNDTPERRADAVDAFAKKLANIAFFHKEGGDFGGIDGELNERNVTVRGIILDLEACSLPGEPERIKKAFEDHKEAQGTIIRLGARLGLPEKRVRATVELFKMQYLANRAAKPLA